MTARKEAIHRQFEEVASRRRRWLERGSYFHSEDLLYLKFLIPEGARILELGCGTGHLLAKLKPSYGVGVDFSAAMIAEARKANPDLTFIVGDIEDEAFTSTLSGALSFIFKSSNISH